MSVRDKFPRVILPNTLPNHVTRRAGKSSVFPQAEAQHFHPPLAPNPETYAPRPITPPPGYETAPTFPRDMRPERLLGMKVVPIALDSATSGEVTLKLTGNVLWIPYSTNASDLIFIRPNDLSDPIPATRGWFLAGVQFTQVRYTIPTAVSGAILYLAYTYDLSEEQVRIL